MPTNAVESGGAEREFKDPTGIKLRYPQDWTVKTKPDRDTLVKMTGKPAPNVEAEITVSLIDDGGQKVDDFAKIFGDLMFSKLKPVRRSSLKTVFTGASGRLFGMTQTVTFTMHGMPVYQEYLFIPATNKVLVLCLTTQNWQRHAVEPAWRTVIDSLDAPQSINAQVEGAKSDRKEVSRAICNTYSNSCAIKRPTKNMTLEQKISAVLPRPEEERFLEIPWRTDLMAARNQSEQIGKPMFIWIMDGNVLGAT